MTETILKAARMAWLFLLLTLFSGQAMALWPWSKERDEKPTLAPMLEKMVPAVVNISTTSRVRIEQNPLCNDLFFRCFFDIVGPRGGNVWIGFAIPSNMAQQIAAQLVQYGEVKRGQLGVVIQDLRMPSSVPSMS